MKHSNQKVPNSIGSFSLANLENLPTPLQALVKASHYLSIVIAEIHKVPENGAFDYEIVSGFTALLNAELKQINLLFIANNIIQKMAEPLPYITAQLLETLQATDNISLSELKHMVTSYHSIGDSLMLISGIALYQHMGVK